MNTLIETDFVLFIDEWNDGGYGHRNSYRYVTGFKDNNDEVFEEKFKTFLGSSLVEHITKRANSNMYHFCLTDKGEKLYKAFLDFRKL